MFIYYNINSVNLQNMYLLNKVKNKTSNGYYYKIKYSSEYYLLDSLIIDLNLNDEKKIQEFLNFEKKLIYKINMKKLNAAFNFKNFISKYKKQSVFIKICGLYSNNYNYGLIYKLINIV
tara:strand:- start:952 stop:1308 length:357 start_codon:yes stop_codon:yes gene_type:complete